MIAVFVTIWASLVLLTLAEAGKGPLAVESRPAQWARPAWYAGALLAVVHSIAAFGLAYGWNHEAAVEATAQQAAAVYGTGWRGSLYVNYVFLALLPLAWSWRHWAWRAFMLTMIANGAIVFARPGARPFGAAVVAALLWAWWPSPRAGAQTRK